MKLAGSEEPSRRVGNLILPRGCAPTGVGLRALVLGLMFTSPAACGGGATAAPDMSEPIDLAIEGHPELLVGKWTIKITQSATCGNQGPSQVMFTATVQISSNGDPNTLTDRDGCPVWTVVGSTACVAAGDTCMAAGSDNGGAFAGTSVYHSDTLATADGKTGTYHASFHETKERSGAVYESCDITHDGTMVRSAP